MPREATGQGKRSPWKNIYISKDNAIEFMSKNGNACYRITIPTGEYAGYSVIWAKKTAREVTGHPELLSLGYMPDSADWEYTFQKYDRATKSVVDTVVVSSAEIANVLSAIAVPAPARTPKAGSRA